MDTSFQTFDSSFGTSTSKILKYVQNLLEKGDTTRYNEIGLWIDNAEANWTLIDRFSADLMRFKDLDEFRADKVVRDKFISLWETLDERKIKDMDEFFIENKW